VIYAAPSDGFGPGVLFSEKGQLIGKTPQSVSRFSVSGTEVASIGTSGVSRVGANASMGVWRVAPGDPEDRLALTDNGAAVYYSGNGTIEWMSPAGEVLARFSLPKYSVEVGGGPGRSPVIEVGQNMVSAVTADKAGSIWYVDRTARQLVHLTAQLPTVVPPALATPSPS
jgi:hypothetical protein